MKTVGMFEAKTHFSALIDGVVEGEEVLVTRKGVPVARIVPVGTTTPRTFGIARALFESGEIAVSDDFDAPLPPDMLRKLES
jgi:prevent-host-death family protein